MSNLYAVNRQFMCWPQNGQLQWPITRMTIAQTPDPKKNCSISLHIVTHLCQFMVQNSEIWGSKNPTTF